MSNTRYFDTARQADLYRIAERAGYPLRKEGKAYASCRCPLCGEGEASSHKLSIFMSRSGIWRWNCFACGEKGSPIDFAAAVWGLSHRDSAKKLAGCDEFANNTPVNTHVKRAAVTASADQADVREVIAKLGEFGGSSVPEVMSYLVDERGLPESLCIEAAQRGIIRHLPSDPLACVRWLQATCGETLLKKAGFWKENSRWPAIAFRPIAFTLSDGGATEFRLARQPRNADEPKSIRYGKLAYPFWWKGENANRVLVVEGALDMLSAVALGERGNIMGVPGCQAWRQEWFYQIRRRYPDVEFVLGLDGDQAGQKAELSMSEHLIQGGFKFAIETLPEGKDWNNLLRDSAKHRIAA